MKSKMKSAFALIAVALMIMVAVVPMALVFTGDSDAAAVVKVDPALDDSAITITGTIYDAKGANAVIGTNYVKATFGSYTFKSTFSGSVYTIELQETSISNVTLTYVDKDGNEVADYSKITLNNLVSGTYKADFKAGNIATTAKLYAQDAATAINSKIGNIISANYTTYLLDGETYTELDQGVFNSDGTATVYYPYSSASYNLYITITSFSATGIVGNPITFVEKQPFPVSSTPSELKVKATEYFVEVTSNDNKIVDELVVEELYTGSDTTKVPLKVIFDKMKYGATTATAVKACFTTETSPSGSATMVVKAPNGTKTNCTVTLAANINFTHSTTSESQIFFGTVKFGTYSQAGEMTVIDTTDATLTSAKVNSDGYFITFVEAGKKLKTLSFTTDTGKVFTTLKIGTTVVKDADVAIPTDTAAIAIEDSTFAVVSGNLYLGPATTTGISGKTLVVTSGSTVDIFGTTVTGTDGAFGFMATADKYVTIEPNDSASYSGNISVVTGSSTGLKIYMSTQKVSIKIANALGAAIDATASGKIKATLTDGTTDYGDLRYNTTSKKFENDAIRGDLTVSECKVYIYDISSTSASGYTFANSTKAKAIAYEKDKVYGAEQASYKMTLYSTEGVALNTITNGDIKVFVAKVYKNTIGSYVYSYDDAANIETFDTGVASFTVKKSLMDAGSSDIGTTPVDVVIAAKVYTGTPATSTLDGKGIFKDFYVLTSSSVDTDKAGVISITASSDFITAKLVRNDKTTPVAGIKVELSNTAGTSFENAQVTYTQNDGSFTFYSATKLKNEKVKFTDLDGYYVFTATGYNVIKSDKKVTSFSPDKDAYQAIFIDADGALIEYEAAAVDGNAVAAATGIFTAKFTSETEPVTVTMTNPTTRSFEKHALTAAEISTGLIVFTSYQSTYTFYVEDGYGASLDLSATTDIEISAYEGDVPVKLTAQPTITRIAKGTYTTVLPVVGKELADYGYKVKTNGGYVFASEVTKITDVETDIETSYAPITIYIRDAAGEALATTAAFPVTAGAIEIFKDGVEVEGGATFATATSRSFTFVNDTDADYAFTVPATSTVVYNFDIEVAADDGVILAKEEWVIGDVTDALGLSIGKNTTEVTAYNYLDAAIGTATYSATGYYYEMLVDVDAVSYYAVTSEDLEAYHFPVSDSPIIAAKEMTVLFNAVTANGYDVEATFTNPKAFDAAGKMIGTATVKGIIVDVEEVEYYQATVAATGALAGVLHFNGISTDGEFVANESYITGSVPYSGNGTQKATIELYLEGNLVKELPANVVNKTEYVAYVDLTGYIGETAGVVFDSILAVYYEDNVEIGYAAVDPYSTLNNIVPPTYEVYTVQLLPPSILIASHVDIDRVGDTVTVTADGNFMIADDEGIYTDGQYTYTFAGWYVDNEKVSASPVFTFELTDDVVISPQYTVTYEKTSDANDKQTPQPQPVQPDNSIDTNVLIIGICAVIVALIAVVYAVIKKE